MFEGIINRKNKVVKGYNTAKHRGRQVLIAGGAVAALVVVGPPFIKGFTEGSDSSEGNPGDSPAPAAATQNLTGGQGGAHTNSEVRLRENTKLFNTPDPDSLQCAFVREADTAIATGKTQAGMVQVATADMEHVAPLEVADPCAAQVWVLGGAIVSITASKQ